MTLSSGGDAFNIVFEIGEFPWITMFPSWHIGEEEVQS